MALIIKGDMPKACSACKSVQRYRYSDECEYLRKPIARNGRLKDCPIIGEIPDKHGRLIDADELKKAVEKMVVCDAYEYTIAHEMVKKSLKMAPTVLEAST